MHGLFLCGMVVAWLYLLLTPGMLVLPSPAHHASGIVSARLLSWSLDATLLPGLAKGLSRAGWCYGIIFVFLLARFCGRFWQLRNLLRGSHLSPYGLSFLFELVRFGSHAPACELRLVDALRSPATAGWLRPRVLLPRDLVCRLGAQQLVHVLRHEVMHVRRRDYLWDGLSTLGCYLIFFHPAAWLARRRLRWERELVCDEGVVKGPGGSRLEYASCLTTLASWWFLDEEAAGQVDFLSSHPSLLGARVRALLTEPSYYGSCKKTALTVLTSGVLAISAILVPEIAISVHQVRAADSARIQLSPHSERIIASVRRGHVSRTRKRDAFALPAVFATSPTPPNLSLPVNLPLLSPQPPDAAYDSSEASASEPRDMSGGRELQRVDKVWDESLPQAPRGRGSKVRTMALRVLKFGIGVAAYQIGGHAHDKAH
jgi:hypothetical protein